MQNYKLKNILLFIVIITFFGCTDTSVSNNPYGVGPISKLELTTISDSLMQRGQKLFKDECSQCHTMEFKNSGPDISDILAIRKPEWLVNFLLNKEEMLQRDSLAIGTRLKYEENCGAKIEDKNKALEILEYLRIYQIWLHEFNVK
jgi:hypothetical protein